MTASRSKKQWILKKKGEDIVYTSWSSFVIACFEFEVAPVCVVYKKRRHKIDQEYLSEECYQTLRDIYSAINDSTEASESVIDDRIKPAKKVKFQSAKVRKTREDARGLLDGLMDQDSDEDFANNPWYCEDCRFENIAQRCILCDKESDMSPRNKFTFKRFAPLTKKRCKSQSEGIEKSVPISTLEEPVWMCSFCDYKNRENITVCQRCHSIRS